VQGWYHNSSLKDLLGDGIFAVDGDKWRQQRKVSSYEFSTKVLRNFSSIIFQKNVARLAHISSEATVSNETIDIQVSLLYSRIEYVAHDEPI
jgi:cytochrome P450